jgi:hypothetical protein
VNFGTIWGRFVEKTVGKKSRATVPLRLFFLLTTIDQIDVFCRQSIIGIDPSDGFFYHRCPTMPVYIQSAPLFGAVAFMYIAPL